MPMARVLSMALGLILAAPAGTEAEAPPLDGDRLLRLSRVADLYLDTALRFTCREKIRWKNLEPGGTAGIRRFDYIFVYDSEQGFQDYRTFPGAGGPGDVPREVSPDESGIPRYVRRAYLWVLLFREPRWKFHDYRLLGEDAALGRPALKIRFEPILPYISNVNEWHGVVWIDRLTSQILRLEAHRSDDERALARLETMRAGEYKDRDWVYVEQFDVEFGVEKNGMRFPSRVHLEGTRRFPKGKSGSSKTSERKLVEVEQTYEDYRFFGVRTAEEIEAVIDPVP